MKISLEFDPATGRWTMVYGAMRHEFRSTTRKGIYEEIMTMGVDMPDAAGACLTLLGYGDGTVKAAIRTLKGTIDRESVNEIVASLEEVVPR